MAMQVKSISRCYIRNMVNVQKVRNSIRAVTKATVSVLDS